MLDCIVAPTGNEIVICTIFVYTCIIPIGAPTRFLFWGTCMPMDFPTSGHRSSFTWLQTRITKTKKVILDRGTDLIRWQSESHQFLVVTGHHFWRPHALGIFCNKILCSYSQPSSVRITMFANLRDEINNCFFEGNESAQKLLAEFARDGGQESCGWSC